ncbi:Hypothetical_protein [Hexamita inflata]|uniref:Hypothetical_protein n=1 Tax=Hexamita inflata TaxID=28002 RepID=A0AA86R517_9EUKA|nr:Hypothetical protein HINF_LOCUS50050 [Hexamita inflata]
MKPKVMAPLQIPEQAVKKIKQILKPAAIPKQQTKITKAKTLGNLWGQTFNYNFSKDEDSLLKINASNDQYMEGNDFSKFRHIPIENSEQDEELFQVDLGSFDRLVNFDFYDCPLPSKIE